MGISDLLSKLFRKKRQKQEIEAIDSRFLNHYPPPQSPINHSIVEKSEKLPSIELQKNSLQLGIAAGYTGRAIKEIESSLNRVEAQMVTKDWFLSQFEDRIPELINILNQHEENEQKRFEAIQDMLTSMQKTAERAPEPIKTELLSQIKAIEGRMHPTYRMLQLIEIVKESKEISYIELASKLGISVSGLRGLLSATVRRTDKIQRFERYGKGWVRYLGDSSDSPSLTRF